jgi:hypothetical protein
MTTCPRPICSRTMRPLDDASPWMMRPLDDAPLYDVSLTDGFRPWVAYRRWVITSKQKLPAESWVASFSQPDTWFVSKSPASNPPQPKLSHHSVRLFPVRDKSYGDHIVQETHHPRDASSKGQNVREISFWRNIGRGRSDILPFQLRR